MAILTWGKPKIEIVKSTAGVPGTPYVEVANIKEDSFKLTTNKGAKIEATLEGGDLLDAYYKKNTYTVEFEVWAVGAKPIVDNDGQVTDNYSLRITPQTVSLAGYIIPNSSVQVEDTFTSKDGKTWKYTFEALKPATGNKLQPYTQA